MTDAATILCAYIRQQAALDMPHYVFSRPKNAVLRLMPALMRTPTAPDASIAPEIIAGPSAQKKPTDTVPNQPQTTRPTPQPSHSHSAVSARQTSPMSGDDKRSLMIELYTSVQQCKRCRLGALRKKQVFGAGSVGAPLFIVGDAPDEDDDREGKPFTGATNELLTGMLKAISLDRTRDVFITNVLKCRPPAGREADSAEIVACAPILARQIEICAPRAILCLGRIAAHELLATTEPVSALRQKKYHYKDIPVVVTWHPAALLNNQGFKRQAWEDLQHLQTLLAET